MSEHNYNNRDNKEIDKTEDRDFDLVRFIKQNQPIAPPPSSNLQLRIMNQVAATAIARPQKNKNTKLGILGTAIFATLGLLIFNQARSLQTAFNENDSLKTEKSLVSNWSTAGEEFTTSYSFLNSSNYQ